VSPGRSTRFSHNLKDDAVYWGSPVPNGSGGRTYADPIEIKVDWEDRQEMFRDAAGQELRSSAVVYCSQDLEEDGVLFFGTLADLDSGQEADPLTIKNAREIKGFQKVPSLKRDGYDRKAWLR